MGRLRYRHHYNPLQPRDRHGRWVAAGGNAAFHAIKKEVKKSAKKKASSSVNSAVNRGFQRVGLKTVRIVNTTKTRGSGLKGLKKNAIPYIRVNKRSQTAGVNAGTVIPGTSKRIVVGGYARLESTSKHTKIDQISARAMKRVFPTGSRQARGMAFLKKNVSVTKPSVRAKLGNAQVRLGTSRGAGPTVIVRRGNHKTGAGKSTAGMKAFDTQIRKSTAKKKKKRPARRRAAARRRKK